MLDKLHQLLSGSSAYSGCILTDCGKLGLQYLGDIDSVITRDGNILRNPQTSFADLINAADSREIIRAEDTGGRIFQIQKLSGALRRFVRVPVRRLKNIFVRNLYAESL